MSANGFTLLEHTATPWVVGLAAGARPVPVADVAAWRAAAVPGSVKIAGLVIGPFSKLIRRRWLRTVVARVELRGPR